VRDFVRSVKLRGVVRITLAALTLALGCRMHEYEIFLEQQEQFASDSSSDAGSDAGTTSDAQPTSGGPVGSDGADASAGDTADASDTGAPSSDTATATDTGDATDTDSPPVMDPDKPAISDVELPDHVYAAGPVPIKVHTEHTGSVSVRLDGADLGALVDEGGGLFTGALPVLGAVDDGWHDVIVTAKQGPHEVSQPDGFTVQAPAPGTEAWSLAGPDGSRTNRIAVTPEGDLIEVGQTEVGGVPQPTIRKRSSVTGAELWPEKTITLDTREGGAVDVAVLPDGRMWVAMNVRPPGKDQRPRIVLLDADGHATGIELEGTAGRVVRGLAVHVDGACFAVGLAGVMGDWDIAYWRIDTAGMKALGDTFDVIPDPIDDQPHSFFDLANDVVINGDVAWVVGMSKGKHDGDWNLPLRGILVPMNVHNAALVGPVSVAPADNGWPQSAFFGAAIHPEGVVTTGYRCDKTCSTYEIMTSRYGVDGKRVWFENDETTVGLAYGSDVVLDSQGRALVAGAVMQNGTLRGYVFGRKVDVLGPVAFDHWYPGVGPSEALGIVRDSFDRLFPAGYVTVSGETQARVTQVHN